MCIRDSATPAADLRCALADNLLDVKKGQMKMLFVWYPKCTTCQRAKKWLDDHGFVYEARDIKEENPSEAELKEWYAKSNLPLRRLSLIHIFSGYPCINGSVVKQS